jgi:hypothetical protein
MVFMDTMCVCVGGWPSALEVLATYQASIYVDIGHAHGTDFLKVEVQSGSVDLPTNEFTTVCNS